MLGREALNDHVLLRLLHLVVSLKVKRVSCLHPLFLRAFARNSRRVFCEATCVDNFGQIRAVLVLFAQINVLQKSFAALLHFDEATFEALPEFVVRGSAHVRTVPHVVLYELFYLIFPLWLQHHLLDRLNSYHQSVNVLDQHVIASNQQLFPRWSTSQTSCRR